MRLYRVFNGNTGYSSVHVIVVASDDEEALRLAFGAFKQKGFEQYPDSYWTNLELKLLTDDADKSFASEVDD